MESQVLASPLPTRYLRIVSLIKQTNITEYLLCKVCAVCYAYPRIETHHLHFGPPRLVEEAEPHNEGYL